MLLQILRSQVGLFSSAFGLLVLKESLLLSVRRQQMSFSEDLA